MPPMMEVRGIAPVDCYVSYSDVVDYNTSPHASLFLIIFSAAPPEGEKLSSPVGANRPFTGKSGTNGRHHRRRMKTAGPGAMSITKPDGWKARHQSDARKLLFSSQSN